MSNIDKILKAQENRAQKSLDDTSCEKINDSNPIDISLNHHPKKPKGFKKILENFWYHHKVATIFSVIIAGIFIYGIILWPRGPQPDCIVVATTYGSLFDEQYSALKTALEKHTPDSNNDGQTSIDFRSIPLYLSGAEKIPINDASDNESTIPDAHNLITDTKQQQKLAVNISQGDITLFIVDKTMYDTLAKSNHFLDLSQQYPNDPIVKDDKVLLNETSLYDAIKLQGAQTGELYICLRDIKYLRDNDSDNVKKAYATGASIIDNIIKSN